VRRSITLAKPGRVASSTPVVWRRRVESVQVAGGARPDRCAREARRRHKPATDIAEWKISKVVVMSDSRPERSGEHVKTLLLGAFIASWTAAVGGRLRAPADVGPRRPQVR
jgi:hypothetical protein